MISRTVLNPFFPIMILLVGVLAQNVVSDDDLAKSATWENPTPEKIEREITRWLDEIGADGEIRSRVLQQLNGANPDDIQIRPLDTVLMAMSVVHPEISSFVAQSHRQRSGLERINFSSILARQGESQFVQTHVRQLYGRWLAQNELFDEALEELNQIAPRQSLAPSSLLFYRGLVEHQLLMKDECVSTISQLLEHEDELPRRFAVLGRLMVADIGPLENDSLDEISRIMLDIRRRQGLFRSGRRVRDQEQAVLKKLDKLIEQIEQQQQSAKSQQANNNSQSSSPMDDSQNASGRGTGEVAGKQQFDGGEWGTLPPEDRAAAMAEMSKDLPPHYRAVIEEYFRRLADETGGRQEKD